jgi:hypothetical protein
METEKHSSLWIDRQAIPVKFGKFLYVSDVHTGPAFFNSRGSFLTSSCYHRISASRDKTDIFDDYNIYNYPIKFNEVVIYNDGRYHLTFGGMVPSQMPALSVTQQFFTLNNLLYLATLSENHINIYPTKRTDNTFTVEGISAKSRCSLKSYNEQRFFVVPLDSSTALICFEKEICQICLYNGIFDFKLLDLEFICGLRNGIIVSDLAGNLFLYPHNNKGYLGKLTNGYAKLTTVNERPVVRLVPFPP